MGTTLQEGIDRSIEELGAELEKTLPSIEKGLSNIDQQIQQAIPELQNHIQGFARQIDEALKAIPSDEANGVVPEATTPEDRRPSPEQSTEQDNESVKI